MASLGKKILSAFVEVSDDQKSKETPPETKPVQQPVYSSATNATSTGSVDSRFKTYFDKLFTEANIPGPDYYEFSKMIEAMQSMADERSRYSAAFAGLSVQGLDKQKLLSTADQYLQVLNTDAANFNNTVDAALKEKVHHKKSEAEEKTKRIQQLQQEIQELENQITRLQQEILENEQKIESSTGGYKNASDAMRSRILSDMEKIKQYIH
jgi:predicted ribosome quality control (RQC) complex YloA/Tae2 family protein